MKRIIAAALSFAMLTALIPVAFAADRVTASDVEKARAVTSLKSSSEDYAIFKEENQYEDISADMAFEKYYTRQYTYIREENKFIEKSCFDGMDAKEAGISEAAYESFNEGRGFEYLYLGSGEGPYAGDLSFHNRNRQNVYLHRSKYELDGPITLFFAPEDMARIINENNLDKPKKIMYLQMSDNDYLCDAENDGGAIVFVTESGEYAVINAEYENGTLTDYILMDSEAFITGMQGDTQKALDSLYIKFKTKDAPAFSDISGESSVDLLARMGIISGYGDGTFGGGRNVTRAEAAKMVASFYTKLVSFERFDAGTNGWHTIDFADVPDSHWARRYITYGVACGYVSGSGEKVGEKKITDNGLIMETDGEEQPSQPTDVYIDIYNFYPENNVTEQELAKMLVCAVDVFGDMMAQAEGGWPYGYAAVAQRLGICENASDRPATRLKAAQMIKNALDAEVSQEKSEGYIEYNETEGGATAAETVYEKQICYNTDSAGYKRVRLKGTITQRVRDNEYKYKISEDVTSYAGDYTAGAEVSILSQYGDLDELIGKNCTIYCEKHGGNLVAIMAEQYV